MPIVSQESILLWDLLNCLKGIDGSYIVSEPLKNPYDPITFKISNDVGKKKLISYNVQFFKANYYIS